MLQGLWFSLHAPAEQPILVRKLMEESGDHHLVGSTAGCRDLSEVITPGHDAVTVWSRSSRNGP
jgi:hypothetical protein